MLKRASAEAYFSGHFRRRERERGLLIAILRSCSNVKALSTIVILAHLLRVESARAMKPIIGDFICRVNERLSSVESGIALTEQYELLGK